MAWTAKNDSCTGHPWLRAEEFMYTDRYCMILYATYMRADEIRPKVAVLCVFIKKHDVQREPAV